MNISYTLVQLNHIMNGTGHKVAIEGYPVDNLKRDIWVTKHIGEPHHDNSHSKLQPKQHQLTEMSHIMPHHIEVETRSNTN